jgi:hypothetical protein
VRSCTTAWRLITRNDRVLSMISTLRQIAALPSVLGLSPWLRTDLILAATLLFLVFASWAMLLTARGARHGETSRALPSPEPTSREAVPFAHDLRVKNVGQGLTSRTLAVLLGLMSSMALFALCAW